MKRASAIVLLLIFTNLLCVPLCACEPILPLLAALLPWQLLLQYGMPFLLVIVLLKSFLFPFLAKEIKWYKAFYLMFIANIVSSVVGFVAAMPAAVPDPLTFLGSFAILGSISILPADHLCERLKGTRFSRIRRSHICVAVPLALLMAYIFFGLSRAALSSHALLPYWAFKIIFVYIGLTISIFITIFYEKSCISAMLTKDIKKPDDVLSCVFRTNAYALLLICGVAAALIIPERAQAPDYLVKRSKQSTVDAPMSPNHALQRTRTAGIRLVKRSTGSHLPGASAERRR